ncbi:MAG TPA: PH domain-containing protein [Actinocrinis sp.]|nr:PH domain-containing protein [Actinocrinis sp.]
MSELSGGALSSPGDGALPVLPITWRPTRTRAVIGTVAVLMTASMTIVAVLLPSDGGEPWSLADRTCFALVGYLGAAVLAILARPKVTADREGLTVVNMLSRNRLEWAQIVRVNLRPGDPWALLDLDSGDTLPVMGIQTANGLRAARLAVADLRALVELYSYADPRR